MPGPCSNPRMWTSERRNSDHVVNTDRDNTGKTAWDVRSGKSARRIKSRFERILADRALMGGKEAGRRK